MVCFYDVFSDTQQFKVVIYIDFRAKNTEDN